MKYTIGTGYYNSPFKKEWSWDANDTLSKPDFFKIWLDNTKKYSSPIQIVVVDCSIDAEKPTQDIMNSVCWIPLKNNLGHVIDIDKSPVENSPKFGGWSASFIISAMIAYNNKSDYIFKEQDCLAFNSWISEFYKPHGYKMLVGKETEPHARLEQSLFWIKWEYIPEFISKYMFIINPDGGKTKMFMRPEHKFHLIKKNYPSDIGFFDFGYGRMQINAPIPQMDNPFYVQQITQNKLDMLGYNKYV